MTDGKLCYTAAVAIGTPSGAKVLCADFPYRSAVDPKPDA
jgi:hypothetical protein